MKTRITELLGIKYPIVMGGMGLVGDVRLTAAVCNAGGLGVLASSNLTPDEVRKRIKELKKQTDKPFGVNIIKGDPWEHEIGQVVVEEKSPVIGYGKGDPGWLMKAVQGYGCLKMVTVGALKQAVKAAEDGADIIVVQGFEGGGHTGYIASMVLLPLVASHIKTPLLAAGGFCDGRGLVAALALGADGIYMGTRFAITKESPIPDSSKNKYLAATGNDLVITALMTGTRSRGLKNKFTELLEKEEKGLSLKKIISSTFEISRTWHVPIWRLLWSGLKYKRLSNATFSGLGTLAEGIPRYYKGVIEGDAEWGWLPAGQVVGRIHDIPTCKELIDTIVNEADRIWREIGVQIRPDDLQ